MAKLAGTCVVLTALVFLLSIGSMEARRNRDRRKPNIIFIMGDDLGWNDVGFHNNRVRTPNIDRLASLGIELTQHYVQPICTPTRSSLMTGYYPSNNGLQQLVINEGGRSCLPLEFKLLPSFMKARGYSTQYVGKWHLGSCSPECLPTNRGFDHFRGITSSQAGYFDWMEDGLVTRFIDDQPSIDGIGTHLSLIEERDVREVILAHDPSDPLFMVISPTAPHTPLEVTEEMFNVHNFLSAETNDTRQRREYLGLVSALDDIVGTTLETLQAKNMLQNSIIVFTSDNGGTSVPNPAPGVVTFANNYPLRNGKFSFFEGGVRVPTLYYDARQGTRNGGTKRDFLMHVTDWLPTFVALGGQPLKKNNDIDGFNQISNLGRKYNGRNKYKVRDEMLVGLTKYNVTRTEEPLCSNEDRVIRWRDWKLLTGVTPELFATQSGITEWTIPLETPELPPIVGDSCYRLNAEGETVTRCLFNLKDDPSETRNLYDQNPKIVRSLLRRLRREDRDGVQNVFSLAEEPSPENSATLGGFAVVRPGYCTPSIDFPLVPQPRECLVNQ